MNSIPFPTHMHEPITHRHRAVDLSLIRGEITGQDKESWFEAERQVWLNVGDRTREGD